MCGGGVRERTQEKTGDVTQNYTKSNYYVICFFFPTLEAQAYSHEFTAGMDGESL